MSNPLSGEAAQNETPAPAPAPAATSAPAKKKKVQVQTASGLNGGRKAYVGKNPHADLTEDEFNEKAACIFHSDTIAFSGSADSQLSADVFDVSSFASATKKSDNPAKTSGGACTNAMLAALRETNNNVSFGDLLCRMRAKLLDKKYTQTPQLSCSHNIDLRGELFSVINPRATAEKPGKRRALCIGINYTGQEGELNGCVNDCKAWVGYLKEQGFKDDEITYITDDAEFTCAKLKPTSKTIIGELKRLVADVQPEDSLFFSFSGHGVQLRDHQGDEEDGYDETLVPVDHLDWGYIRDENLFKILVGPLPGGVRCIAVTDCCHSGSVLDLPFTFTASAENIAKFQKGELSGLMANAIFSFDAATQFVSDVASGVWDAFADLNSTIQRRCCGCC